MVTVAKNTIFTFSAAGDPGFKSHGSWLYFGPTNQVVPIPNTEAWKYIHYIYQETTGLQLQDYHWNTSAPVYQRLFQTFEPWAYGERFKEQLEVLRDRVNEYTKAYAKPKWFVTLTSLQIRSQPALDANILGVSTVFHKFEILDTVKQCNHRWGLIKYNGQDAYIAMEHFDGTAYGEMHLTEPSQKDYALDESLIDDIGYDTPIYNETDIHYAIWKQNNANADNP